MPNIYLCYILNIHCGDLPLLRKRKSSFSSWDKVEKAVYEIRFGREEEKMHLDLFPPCLLPWELTFLRKCSCNETVDIMTGRIRDCF